MHDTVTWRAERIDDEEGEIHYEAHGPRDSFITFEGPNAKADCERFMSADKLREALTQLVSYALTAQSHSPAWLEGMADKINHAAELLGDPDRAEVYGEGLRVRKGG